MTRYPASTNYDSQPYPFSRGPTTRLICLVGLAACWIVCGSGLVLGIFTYRRGVVTIGVSNSGREVMLLALVSAISLINEVLGYIHGTTLRWALAREGRLEFNTNLRLLPAAKLSTLPPNWWPVNLLMLLALVVSYSSAPLNVFDHSSGQITHPATPPKRSCFLVQ
ncbi:uncharacterized protein EI97DRAFT_455681 [Westerdykella ornata]|uniref:Uncharacterized protein n=1 Tax=Westerdykella ornata TaxID=318751 RepID=A0A6A6JSS1_WESOR|nr:uncharacterized protein EI97DRAFT_455681 [Westerdykella ornata]KAF2279437.1 hypothetical protein EI97DRAFT_455681 [Westerdykella ornata]